MGAVRRSVREVLATCVSRDGRGAASGPDADDQSKEEVVEIAEITSTMCGQTKIYGKFVDYLARREFDVGKFSIEMVESDHLAWNEIFLKYQAALLKMPCMQGRTLHWIGSTAVPDIPAKPIIDLLVGTDDVAETVQSIALGLSVDVWRRPCGLHFPLGFIDINKRCDDWGFLQLPPQLAVRVGVLGCNLHVLKKTSRSYMEEVAMVEFLSSSSGVEYRRRYGEKKKELANAIARKEQDINKYSEEKTTIIEEIFAAARREGFLKDTRFFTDSADDVGADNHNAFAPPPVFRVSSPSLTEIEVSRSACEHQQFVPCQRRGVSGLPLPAFGRVLQAFTDTAPQRRVVSDESKQLRRDVPASFGPGPECAPAHVPPVGLHVFRTPFHGRVRVGRPPAELQQHTCDGPTSRAAFNLRRCR